jgi:hypothetical protein
MWNVLIDRKWLTLASEDELVVWIARGALGPTHLVQHASWPTPLRIADMRDMLERAGVPSERTFPGPPPEPHIPQPRRTRPYRERVRIRAIEHQVFCLSTAAMMAFSAVCLCLAC